MNIGAILNLHPQKFLPLPDVAFEADASGNLESRDHASLNGLAALPGTLTGKSVFPARPIKVSSKFVVLAGLQLSQQLLNGLLNLGEFGNKGLPVHSSCIITICSHCKPRPGLHLPLLGKRNEEMPRCPDRIASSGARSPRSQPVPRVGVADKGSC